MAAPLGVTVAYEASMGSRIMVLQLSQVLNKFRDVWVMIDGAMEAVRVVGDLWCKRGLLSKAWKCRTTTQTPYL